MYYYYLKKEKEWGQNIKADCIKLTIITYMYIILYDIYTKYITLFI